MKKIEKLYFILTYLFFIYPPFIFGLVEIYQSDRYEESTHITSLYVNLILVAVIALVLFGLIQYKKLHFPNKLEIRFLIFGLIGNIVMYFYTFQNLLKIDNIVTIYLVLLVVLAADFYLISKRIRVKELWVLLTLFLIVDYLHLLLTGCGFEGNWDCDINHTYDILITFIYSITLLSILIFYVHRILTYKQFDFFKIVNIIFVIVLSYGFANDVIMDEKFILTVSILLPFFLIVDFIVSIVNKSYTHKTLLFYVRMLTILAIFAVVGLFDFFRGEVDVNILTIMVITTYSTLGINILAMLLKVEVSDDIPFIKTKETTVGLQFSKCNEEDKNMIKELFSEKHSNHIDLGEEAYSLVAKMDGNIIGFISSYIKNLTEPLSDIKEAYVNILEVKEEYRNQGIASTLIEKTERYFAHRNITQLRGWSSDDKVEAIKLWSKLRYSLSPTTIWIEDKKVSVSGYYFIKKIR